MTGLDIATALGVRTHEVRPRVEHLLGWVTSTGTMVVTVQLPDGEIVTNVPRLRAYGSPQINDLVLILKAAGVMYVLGALNAAPAPPPEPPEPDPPPPRPTTRTRTFRPNFTGSYTIQRGSWSGGNLAQGNKGQGMRLGAAYYGSGPSGLSGSAISGKLRVKRVQEGRDGVSMRPTFRLLKAKNRPGGQPAYSKTMRGPALRIGQTATVNLPTGWVADLMAGRAGGIGIGVDQPTPHIALAGRNSWGAAMELTIKWKG